MSDDLNIIKSLQYKKKLELENLYLDNIFGYEQGYATDQHGRIVGLNLHLCGLIVGGNISRLLHLTHLDLSENRIAKLRFLENLKNLTHLHLTDNKVKDIEELAGLENLNLLYLNENPIKDYSPLKKLKKLTHLYLNSNQITDFSFLEELTNLKVLNLSRCNLELLHNLEKLKKLTHLYLSGNKIKNIEHLIELKHLKRLDLRFNRVDRLPREIVDMKMNIYWTDDDKDGVLLKKNPIDIPPIEILNKGNAGVKNYLKSLFGKNQALNEVKVLLVGDGGSGKTSLTRRLCGDPFNKNEPQTHGINIKLKDMGSNKSPIKAHYWDFGGQEILHATHQFFLSKRSLYILVSDGRREDKIEYWLKHIESFGGDSPVLVVMNKIDQNPTYDVNRLFLKEKYPNIKGFFRISCETDKGIDSFKKKLREELKEMEMCTISWPTNWFMVKTHLETNTKHYISFDDYQTICRKEKITDISTRDTLLEFLHDLGVILHFKELALADTNVLNPSWVTRAVYKIIESDLVNRNNGVLHLDMIPGILREDRESGFCYPPAKYVFIIELMKKFELCYQLEQQSVLIPEQLDIQEKKFKFDYTSALKFIFDYDFLPTSIMQRFIVKTHTDINNNLIWRTGVVLKSKLLKATAVLKSDPEAGTLSIWVGGHNKREYFVFIRYILQNINDSFEKLSVKELVPMPDNPGITISYDHLKKHEEMELATCFPDGANHDYQVQELLDGVEKRTFEKEEISTSINNISNIDLEKLYGSAFFIQNFVVNQPGAGNKANLQTLLKELAKTTHKPKIK